MKKDLITYLNENNIALGIDEGLTEIKFINDKMGHGRFALKQLYTNKIRNVYIFCTNILFVFTQLLSALFP